MTWLDLSCFRALVMATWLTFSRRQPRRLVATRDGLDKEVAYVEWVAKASAVPRASFGAGSHQAQQLESVVEVRNERYTTGNRLRDIDRWRLDAAQRGKGVRRAAIYTLETLTDDESPLDDASIDPDLWVHAQGLVVDNDLAKVPAAVAIFIEDRIRIWAGDPGQATARRLLARRTTQLRLTTLADRCVLAGSQVSGKAGARSAWA
jgi:hypothetical protein